MECKLAFEIARTVQSPELIDTLWNVNQKDRGGYVSQKVN